MNDYFPVIQHGRHVAVIGKRGLSGSGGDPYDLALHTVVRHPVLLPKSSCNEIRELQIHNGEQSTQRVGATDEVAAPATEEEARAFEALRAIIRQAVLAERATQDDAVNQAASAAAEEAEEARQMTTRIAEELEKEKATTAKQATTIATLKAELAAAATEAARLRDELAQQREVASTAREEAAEARGKLFVYEQQALAEATESPAPAKETEQSVPATTTSAKKKA